jgi:hypothetical protein
MRDPQEGTKKKEMDSKKTEKRSPPQPKFLRKNPGEKCLETLLHLEDGYSFMGQTQSWEN